MPVPGEVFLSLVPLHLKWSESAVTLETCSIVPSLPAGRLNRYVVSEISYHKGCKFTMKKIYLDISGNAAGKFLPKVCRSKERHG